MGKWASLVSKVVRHPPEFRRGHKFKSHPGWERRIFVIVVKGVDLDLPY